MTRDAHRMLITSGVGQRNVRAHSSSPIQQRQLALNTARAN